MSIPTLKATPSPGAQILGGLNESLQTFLNIREQQQTQQKEKAQVTDKFNASVEKDIDASLKFFNFNPKNLTQQEKQKFKQDSIDLFNKTGNPQSASLVVQDFVGQEAQADPQSFLSRLLTGKPTTEKVAKTEPQAIQKIVSGEAPKEEAKRRLTAREGGPSITDLFGQPSPEDIGPQRTEIGGIPIDQISPAALSFLTQAEAFGAEGREGLKRGGKKQLSGATFGLSQAVPGLKVSPAENRTQRVLDTANSIAGGIQSSAALEKYVVRNLGAKAGQAVFNVAKTGKLVKALATQIATKAAIRGTTAAGLTELNSFIQKGEPADLKDVVKNGLTIAGIGAAIDAVGDVGIPLQRSLSNIAKQEGISTWDAWKQFGRAVKNKGFSFFKNKPNSVTPAKVAELGEEFTSVKALPTPLQEQVKEKAKSFGIKPEAVAMAARANATEQGIDINAVENNDPEATTLFGRTVQQLNNEDFPKVKEVVKEAEKPKIEKELLKERERKARSLVRKAAKSPLEVYFEPKPEVQHRPETIAKKEAFQTDVDKREKAVKEKILDINDIQLDLEQRIRQSNNRPEIAKMKKDIEKLIDSKLDQQKELKELAFERSQGTRRPTELEVTSQIATTFDNMKEAISNPQPIDAKKAKQIAAQTKRDREALVLAEKLLKRGELLSDLEAKTFRTIKEQYQDAYKVMKKLNDELIEDNQDSKDKTLLKEVEEAKKMNKILDDRIKVNQASIVKDNDRRAIKKLSRGAKGSFFKKSLGDLRQDVDFFQKQVFKQNRLKSQIQLKTERVKQEIFNKMVANPTVATIKKAAQQDNVNFNELKQQTDSLAKEIQDEPITKEEIKEKMKEIHENLEEKGKKKAEAPKEDTKAKAKEKTAQEKAKTKEDAAIERTTKARNRRISGIIYEMIRLPLRLVGFSLPPWRSISSLSLDKALTPFAAVSLMSTAVLAAKKVIKTKRINKFRRLRVKNNSRGINDFERELLNKGISQSAINKMKEGAGI